MPCKFLLPGERQVKLAYDSAKRVVREVDPLGRTTTMGYDGNSLRVNQLTLPDGSHWRARYDYLGRLLLITDPLGRHDTYEYGPDLNPRPIAHVDARGGQQRMEWNRRGQLVAYTDCSGKTTRYEYDADGYLAGITDALGQVTHYERRHTGEVTRITLPDGSTEEFRYDAAGLLLEQRRGSAQTRRWVRNPRGQVLDAVDPANRHLHYRYDSHGRIVELASDDATRYRFAYDHADRIAHETRPDGVERHLRYDATGELASIEKLGVARGDASDRPRRITHFENDKVGRLLTYLTETATTRFQWDDGDRPVMAMRVPTQRGHELGMVPGEVRFDYDAAGRLVAEHGANGTVHYTLDDLDNLVRLDLPHGVGSLVASHALSWARASNEARLDPYNGLLLLATLNRLFGQGPISFADSGTLLRHPRLTAHDRQTLGLTEGMRMRLICPAHQPYLAASRHAAGLST